MRIERDEYSGRPVANDAYPSLEAFRAAGAKSFHNFEVETVREMYITSCEASPLVEDHPPAQTDFEVEGFKVRLYEPRSTVERTQRTPAILFLHGGGWVMGGLRTHHFVARRLAGRTQLPVLAVDYRLAPEHPYPAAIEDSRKALHWFVERDDIHGVRVGSLSLVGDSAGGQLAAVLTNEFAAKSPEILLDSQVLLYPVTDLSERNIRDSSSYQRLREGFPLVADTMKWFADNYVERGAIRERPDISPAFADLPDNLPDSYVITVDNDPLADEGIRYAEMLRSAGAGVVHDHLIGYAHGLFTSAGKIPTGETYLNKVADFISSQAQAR